MAKPSIDQAQAYRMELTAWFGLAIFAISLVAQLLAVSISFASLTGQSHMMSGQLSPVVVVGLVVPLLAGILPPLVAYLAGEK